MIFGQTTPVNSDRKCQFQILSGVQRLQQCRSRNSLLLQVTRCIQLVHRQNMETSAGIFSYQRDQRRPFSSTLICISKIHYFVRKTSQNAGVNRAEKAYHCIVYTPMRSRITSNPRVYVIVSYATQMYWRMRMRHVLQMSEFE